MKKCSKGENHESWDEILCFCSLIRYNVVLEACCLLPDLAELPFRDMTEVSVLSFFHKMLYVSLLLAMQTLFFKMTNTGVSVNPTKWVQPQLVQSLMRCFTLFFSGDWRERCQPERRTASASEPGACPLQRAPHPPAGWPSQCCWRLCGLPHLL